MQPLAAGGGVSWPLYAATVAAALLVTAIVLRLAARSTAAACKARPPAGSLGWPLVGETLQFISAAYSSRPESFVEKRCRRYGKVFRSHLWGSPAVVSADAEASRAVLQSDASAFVPWYPRSLMELMGESSILVLGGALQRRVHGLAGAFFKSPELKARVTADMRSRLAAAMDAWRATAATGAGAAVRVQDEAKLIVFEILVRALIGLEQGQEMNYLRQQFHIFIAGLISLPIKLPGTQLYRSLKAKKRMTSLIQNIIQEKRRRIFEGKDLCAVSRDLIDVLMSNGSDELSLTDELISDNMIDFMIPAEDSVPVLITLAIKYLSECPLALQQLEVITETLRIGNIISGIMRKAVRDVEVKGQGDVVIPKGWCVLVYFRSVHLDANIYDDPYAFNPWRWKERDMAAATANSGSGFTPFGGGQRLCPGLDLARLQTSIFLHHLVTNFTWVAQGDVVVNFPTVRLKRGMPIKVTPKT
uniref:Cytochrome P450 n=1 Tax=Oryza sativa subsp. japonica TaxID=39947 RepID=Q5TKD4_ORYSJ|nr:putative cytochrome P450 [Oryza sativa Japonica Group]